MNGTMRPPTTAAAAVALLITAAMASLPALRPAHAAGEPPLPTIAGDADEPAAADQEPPLPAIETPAREPAEPRPAEGFSAMLDHQLRALPLPLYGFWEARLGPRYVQSDQHSRDFTLGETRLQLESDPYWQGAQFMLTTDFLYDTITRELRLEVREANVAFSPAGFVDVKAGRQILTWGTGDLVFLNDLFPKDYVSFFIGRDVEYLKAPSDALKVSLFAGAANLDIVYVPHFDPDTFVSGKRLAYYNPLAMARAGENVRLRADEPGSWFTDDEVHLRLYRNLGSYELAAYAYRGFWKSPMGIDPVRGLFTFPELSVYGASARGPVAAGIGNLEFAWYDSRQDRGGTNPFVPNSQLRFLLGYSQDLPRLMQDFTLGVQYYLEHMLEHSDYRRTLPAGFAAADENRHLLTLRLTKLLMNQDMTLSLFTFWSPSDHDAYLRPHVSYDITDSWRIDGGANIFLGDDVHTQFGGLDQNNNLYVGLRYSF